MNKTVKVRTIIGHDGKTYHACDVCECAACEGFRARAEEIVSTNGDGALRLYYTLHLAELMKRKMVGPNEFFRQYMAPEQWDRYVQDFAQILEAGKSEVFLQ